MRIGLVSPRPSGIEMRLLIACLEKKAPKLRFPWCSGDHSLTNCGVAESDSVVEENHTDSSEIGADRGYARICPDKAASVERLVKSGSSSQEVGLWEVRKVYLEPAADCGWMTGNPELSQFRNWKHCDQDLAKQCIQWFREKF
jgi:hypothetical protein